MASAITHAVVGAALAQAGRRDWRERWTYWFLAVFCSVLPDIDVIGFRFGIHYGDLWGHRGMTHSLLFAAITEMALSLFVTTARDWWKAAFLLFVITASHGLLDAMTDGGLGVAFFSPFNRTRYFLVWRPIHVSPIAAHRFFSGRGLTILWSEIKCVWWPALLTGALLHSWRKRQESDIHCALSPPW
jgi:inner membrane protein